MPCNKCKLTPAPPALPPALPCLAPCGRPARLPAPPPPPLQGRPVFAFSTMSPHTADVKKDGRCSLTVMAEPFRGIADGRVNLIGRMVALKDGEEQAAAKAAYMAKHPGSFWVEFGDFRCAAGRTRLWWGVV